MASTYHIIEGTRRCAQQNFARLLRQRSLTAISIGLSYISEILREVFFQILSLRKRTSVPLNEEWPRACWWTLLGLALLLAHEADESVMDSPALLKLRKAGVDVEIKELANQRVFDSAANEFGDEKQILRSKAVTADSQIHGCHGSASVLRCLR